LAALISAELLAKVCLEHGSPKLNFAMPEFSDVGRAGLVTVSTFWRLIHWLVLSWKVTKRHSNRSKRGGNTLVWVVWILLSVMLVCIVLWAATGAVALLFGAVLAGLGVLYVVLLTNL
jgi:peptidoglycan biosynthesis protein MviN/MurJ (putative lipid II flippase)